MATLYLNYDSKNAFRWSVGGLSSKGTKVILRTSSGTQVDYTTSYTGTGPYGTSSRTVSGYTGTAGSTYSFKAYNLSGGTEYLIGSASFTNPKPSTPRLSAGSSTQSSINVYASCSGSFSYINVVCVQTGAVRKVTRDGGYATFNNLSAGKSYTFEAVAYDSDGWASNRSSSLSVSTQAPDIKIPMPSLSFTAGLTSVKVSWTRPSGANTLYYKCWAYGASEPSAFKNVSATAQELTISGLTQNTTYKFKTYYGTTTAGYTNSDTRFIDPAFTTTKPTFNWSTNPVAGNNFSVTASDWRNLQDTIDARRGVSYGSWTRAVSGNSLTAAMWNQVIDVLTAANVSSATRPAKVSSGDSCLATNFVKLKNAVNSI